MIAIQREIVNALMVAGGYFFIFVLGEGVRRMFPANAELSRKTVHLLGGLTALSFPYLFNSHWTVLALSVSFCGILLITKRKGLLPSVHNVERKSRGGLYYPAAIYLIFLLSRTKPVVYLIAILVMAVSDTMAALAGGRYGRVKFDVEGSLKSLEGSAAFFLVTFLCVHLPLLLLTQTGRAESVLMAVIIALLVTGFEAVSFSGSDNIIVPFGTYFMLSKFMRHPLEVIIWQTEILLIVIAAGLIMYIRPRLLKTSGLIAIIMLNYAALSLCNYYWFLPLFLAQVMYYLLILGFVRCEGAEKVASFPVKVLLYIGVIPTVFLFLSNAHKNHLYFYLPYLTSITAQAAIIADYFVKYIRRPIAAGNYWRHHRKLLEIVCSVTATLFIAGLPIYFYKIQYRVSSLIIVMIGTWAAYILNFMMNRYYRGVKDDVFEYRRRFVSAALGVALVFLLQRAIGV